VKRKITLFGICLVAAATLAVVYIAGWHAGSMGQRPALINEAQAAGKEAPPR